MTPWAWSVFLLGLSTGVSALWFSEYLLLSPGWFRWVLVVSGIGVMSRYLLLFLTMISWVPWPGGVIRLIEVWAAIGLTLPCAVALDQLVRHPAMTPKKLLLRYAPMAAAFAPLLILGHASRWPDPVLGAIVGLSGSDAKALAILHGAFALITVWIVALLIRKLPGLPLRRAFTALAATQVLLTAQRLAGSLTWLDVRLVLAAEAAVLAAIWAALKTSRSLGA